MSLAIYSMAHHAIYPPQQTSADTVNHTAQPECTSWSRKWILDLERFYKRLVINGLSAWPFNKDVEISAVNCWVFFSFYNTRHSGKWLSMQCKVSMIHLPIILTSTMSYLIYSIAKILVRFSASFWLAKVYHQWDLASCKHQKPAGQILGDY